MGERRPTVSVCIPTYNRAEMLRATMTSVLTQTFEDFQLIVCDNASPDATESVVRSFRDKRVRYVRNDRNLGVRGNWSRCLSLADGEYVSIFPDDDLMLPHNLERKVEVLRRHPRVGLVHSKYHVIDNSGTIVKPNTNWGHGPDRTIDAIQNGFEVLTVMLATYNIINAPTVLLRRACVDTVGDFTTRLRLTFDWEYWMRIAVYYDVAFLAEPLVKWRLHAASQTSLYSHAVGKELTPQAFREELKTKRLMVTRYRRALPNPYRLRRQVRQEIVDRIIERADRMGQDGRRCPAAGIFVLAMGRTFPEIFLTRGVWRLLLRSVLTEAAVNRLRAWLGCRRWRTAPGK